MRREQFFSIKKKIMGLALTVGACIALTACGTNEAASDELVLSAGFSTSPSDPRVEATEVFKAEVEKATGGRITIEIHPDGELGADSELIEGVVNGNVDITASSAGNFANYDANVGLSAFPFLFQNFDEAWAFVDGDVEAKAEAKLADYNIKVLGHYDNGFRCVTTSDSYGPVNTVQDMDGMVIRTPENRIVMQTMLTLGAQPEVLAFTEVYGALKDGKFDAQENPIPVIYNNNLYEVQENLAITNHSYDVMLFVIRDDIWNKLSDGDQKILLDAAAKAQAKDRELVKKQTEDYVKKLEDEGMQITYPDLSEFKSATKPVIDALAKDYDEELISAIR